MYGFYLFIYLFMITRSFVSLLSFKNMLLNQVSFVDNFYAFESTPSTCEND